MAKEKKNQKSVKNKPSASVVRFEIPADNIERARAFYGSLFGWKLNRFLAAVPEYWHIDTGGKVFC